MKSVNVELHFSKPPTDLTKPFSPVVQASMQVFDGERLICEAVYPTEYHFPDASKLPDLKLIRDRLARAFTSGLGTFTKWGVDTSGSDTAALSSVTYREWEGESEGEMWAAELAFRDAFGALQDELLAQGKTRLEAKVVGGDPAANIPPDALAADAQVPEAAPVETIKPAPESNAALAA